MKTRISIIDDGKIIAEVKGEVLTEMNDHDAIILIDKLEIIGLVVKVTFEL